MDFNTSIWDCVTFNNDSYDETTKVALNDFGIELLEERFTDNFRFWIPVLLSNLMAALSLIKSFDEELASRLKRLMQLLK